ncbi:MAG: hypothetical protein IM591_12800 [Chitinophagaceae bacterium]|jgi:hypothetical protein|nr:hypothetical protein [Chitinophagaceae bacterium]
MFSYFKGGIKDTSPIKNIDLPELVRIIRENPQSLQIEAIRRLKRRGDNYYKTLKENLSNITPNCIVKKRNLTGDQFGDNFISPSGYLYVDIDKVPNTLTYKQYLIEKYGNLASMICVSPGGDGITLLFKVTNTITRENFNETRSSLIKTTLKDEMVDPNAGGIGRAMFISHDPEVWVNYDNSISIRVDEKELLETHPNTSCSTYNRVDYQLLNDNTGSTNNASPFIKYKIHSIDVVLSILKTKTVVPVLNPRVDFKPVEFVSTYIPKIITDGNKHRTYYKLIHQLYYLNPSIQMEYLFSFLFYINNTRSKPKMEMRELVRFFSLTVEKIKSTGEVFVEKNIQRVHFNPAERITPKEKQIIAAQLNGAYTKSLTIDKIVAAKIELERQGTKITNRAIARVIQMDEKTVGKYINSSPIDMDYEVSLWN